MSSAAVTNTASSARERVPALPRRYHAPAGGDGWFSEFTDLSKAPSGRVEYGRGRKIRRRDVRLYEPLQRAAVFKFSSAGAHADKLRELNHTSPQAGHGIGFEPASQCPS